MSNSSLATIRVPSVNYTVGRDGKKIEMITIHHMAGVSSAKKCGEVFQDRDRGSSAHYGVGKDGEIGLYVDEANTAWANTDWDSNCKAVTIENSNSSSGGNWPVSDKVLNSLIKLVADIAKRNNLGTLVPGKNLTWHSMYAQTACPGDYLRSKMQYIADEANKINITLEIEEITSKKVKVIRDTNLWNLEFSDISKAEAVKPIAKDTIVENIVAIAHHECGANYYMTKYSYDNKINNGINVLDSEDCVEEKEEIETPVEEVENSIEIPKEENEDEKIGNLFKTIVDMIIKLFKLIFKG